MSSIIENFTAGMVFTVLVSIPLSAEYTLWVSNFCADTVTEQLTGKAAAKNLIRP